MTTALLSIGRGIRSPADVSAIARQLTSLLEDAVKSDGGTIDLTVDGGMAGTTSAPPSAVRLALAEALLPPAVAEDRHVTVRVRATTPPTVEMHSETGFEIPADVLRVLTAGGIRITTDGHGISMVFPPPIETTTEDA